MLAPARSPSSAKRGRLAYGMLAVAAGHVAAAFKHRWFDRHDVIRRVTFESTRQPDDFTAWPNGFPTAR